MNWTKIRFLLSHSGHYADCQVGIVSDSIPEAAQKAAVFCDGYEAGCGLKAILLEVRGNSLGDNGYVIPRDTERLALYLNNTRLPYNE